MDEMRVGVVGCGSHSTDTLFPVLRRTRCRLAADAGLTVVEQEDLSADFGAHIPVYLEMVQTQFKQAILENYGPEMYDGVVDGLVLWRDAAASGKVGRGRLIARKPE